MSHLLHSPDSWLAGKTLCGAAPEGARHLEYNPKASILGQVPEGTCPHCRALWIEGEDEQREDDAYERKYKELRRVVSDLLTPASDQNELTQLEENAAILLNGVASLMEIPARALELEDDLTIRLAKSLVPADQWARVNSLLDGNEGVIKDAYWDWARGRIESLRHVIWGKAREVPNGQ